MKIQRIQIDSDLGICEEVKWGINEIPMAEFDDVAITKINKRICKKLLENENPRLLFADLLKLDSEQDFTVDVCECEATGFNIKVGMDICTWEV